MAIDAVLPPSDTRIRCIAKFITTHKDVIDDPTKLAKLVFSKHPSISVEDGTKKIQQALEYYKDCFSATQSALCKDRGTYFSNNTVIFYITTFSLERKS